VKAMHLTPFQECKHIALLYDSEQHRDDEIIKFINQGLARGQLCIYGTIHVRNKEYFKTLFSRIKDYEENTRNGNLMVVDFVPFYLAAVKGDLTPYKEVQKSLEEMLEYKKDMKVRYVGDATGYLFKNRHFDECIMIEDWWQGTRMKVVTTLCLFQKSLMDSSPFNQHKKRIIATHDVVVDSRPNTTTNVVDQEPVPAARLKEVFQKLEGLIGRTYTEEIIEELKQLGIDLSGKRESYFLHEIHEALDLIFGLDAAELLMERLKTELSD
jgi:DcmR-like sensory protein